jgi:hypothetical protein
MMLVEVKMKKCDARGMRVGNGIAKKFGYSVSPEVENIVVEMVNKVLDIWEREIDKRSIEATASLMSSTFINYVVVGTIGKGLVELLGPNLRSKQDAVGRVQPALVDAYRFIKSLSVGKTPSVVEVRNILNGIEMALCSPYVLDKSIPAGLACPKCSPPNGHAITQIVSVGDRLLCLSCDFEGESGDFKGY